MVVCVPTTGTGGLDEAVHGHFGSAPFYVIVDTKSGALTYIPNAKEDDVDGECDPTASFGGHQVDILVVQSIGQGALAHLVEMGIRVGQSAATTVHEAVDQAQSGFLLKITPKSGCGHSGQHSCEGC